MEGQQLLVYTCPANRSLWRDLFIYLFIEDNFSFERGLMDCISGIIKCIANFDRIFCSEMKMKLTEKLASHIG